MDCIDNNIIFSFRDALEACETSLKSSLEKIQGANEKPQTIRFEFQIEPLEILSWLNAQETEQKFFWSDREKEFVVGGIGIADSIEWKTSVDYDKILTRIRTHLLSEYFHQRYYGGICFDASYLDGDWMGFGSSRFLLPRFEIFQTQGRTFFACNLITSKNIQNDIAQFCRDLQRIELNPRILPVQHDLPFKRQDFPNHEQWNYAVNGITENIKKGRYAKIVLARKSCFQFDRPLNPYSLIRQLENMTSDCFLFSFQFKNDEAFLGASPERLYRRMQRTLLTEAIAGTRPRGETPAEEKQFSHELVHSKKDAHEHQIVVDVIQEKLDRLCEDLEWDSHPALLSLKGGLHLISRLRGQLKESVTDVNLLNALHPTPAIAGAPTLKAMVEIKNKESFSRGWYCGPVGFVGSDHAEFVVAIRSGLLRQNSLSLFSGAGIVEASTASEEWNEIEHKLNTFLKIFQHESSNASQY